MYTATPASQYESFFFFSNLPSGCRSRLLISNTHSSHRALHRSLLLLQRRLLFPSQILVELWCEPGLFSILNIKGALDITPPSCLHFLSKCNNRIDPAFFCTYPSEPSMPRSYVSDLIRMNRLHHSYCFHVSSPSEPVG